MGRSVMTAILAAALVVTQAQPGQAGREWCEEDPVLTIDGRTVDYTVSFPMSYVSGTTVDWVFHIPENVRLASAITPPGAGSPSIPSTVRIYRDLAPYTLLSTAPVGTEVTVNAGTSFATSTAVQGANASWTMFSGRSNKTVTFSIGYSALPLLY